VANTKLVAKPRWSAAPTTSPGKPSLPSSSPGTAPDRRRSQAHGAGIARLGRQGNRPIAKPKDIRFGDNLPKTRSGKIMRRLLRSIARGEEITQDISTLENPAILEQLRKGM